MALIDLKKHPELHSDKLTLKSDLKTALETILGQPLSDTLYNLVWLYKGEAEMQLGVKGLPKTSAMLVDKGWAYIDGNYLCAHPEIIALHKESEKKQDKLLKKMKALAQVQKESK